MNSNTKALGKYLIHKKDYSEPMAYRLCQIVDGMIMRSPHREEHIYSVARTCDMYHGVISQCPNPIISKIFKDNPYYGGLYDSYALFDISNLRAIKFAGFEACMYLNFTFNHNNISNIQTLAHEFGHAVNRAETFDEDSLVLTTFHGCSRSENRVLLPPRDGFLHVECLSPPAYGLREVINSLHTSDLIRAVFGKNARFSYEIMTEVVSRIRELYGLEDEFLQADEGNNYDLLVRAVNKKVTAKLRKAKPAKVLEEYCNKIAEFYWKENRNDYIDDVQKLTDDISAFFKLDKHYPRIVVTKLEAPDDGDPNWSNPARAVVLVPERQRKNVPAPPGMFR